MLTAKFSEITKEDVTLVGGKGTSLADMTTEGIPVPPGFIVTTEAYRKYDGQIPDDFADELFRCFDDLDTERVAVRSSAIAEDSPGNSWAGQFASYLNVEREDLISRVQDCWKSVDSGKVYAAATNNVRADLAMAVVVQKMVESDVSGVAFSANPISKADDEVMIEAIYGLGELLVQGMVTPDNYVVSKSDQSSISSTIVAKERKLSLHDGTNIELPVPTDKVSQPCLTEAQISELTLLVIDIEKHFGSPQDIEWAFEKGKFYIVQSRPITTL